MEEKKSKCWKGRSSKGKNGKRKKKQKGEMEEEKNEKEEVEKTSDVVCKSSITHFLLVFLLEYFPLTSKEICPSLTILMMF